MSTEKSRVNNKLSQHKILKPTWFSSFAIWKHFPIDQRSIEAFRVGLGIILIIDACHRLTNLSEYYGSEGIVKLEVALKALRESGSFINLLFVGNEIATLTELCLVILFGLALVFGFWARLAAFAAWILTCIIQARNPWINHGGDAVYRLLLFWAFLMPIGRTWRFCGSRFLDVPLLGSRNRRNIPVICAMVQVAIIYWFSALHKNDPMWRVNYTALETALSLKSFQGPLAAWSLEYPSILRGLTLMTIILQELGPTLCFIFFRIESIRLIIISLFLAFHIGTGLTLKLGLFPVVCSVAWLLFLPSSFWNYLLFYDVSSARHVSDVSVVKDINTVRLSVTRLHSLIDNVRVTIALMAILFVVLWNIVGLGLPGMNWMKESCLIKVTKFLELDQKWAMFSPRPPSTDGYFELHVKDSRGHLIQLYPHSGQWASSAPVDLSKFYLDPRWQKFLRNVYEARKPDLIESCVNYWIASAKKEFADLDIGNVILYYNLSDSKKPFDKPKKLKVFPCPNLAKNGLAIYDSL